MLSRLVGEVGVLRRGLIETQLSFRKAISLSGLCSFFSLSKVKYAINEVAFPAVKSNFLIKHLGQD